jgi:hypothetical protein
MQLWKLGVLLDAVCPANPAGCGDTWKLVTWCMRVMLTGQDFAVWRTATAAVPCWVVVNYIHTCTNQPPVARVVCFTSQQLCLARLSAVTTPCILRFLSMLPTRLKHKRHNHCFGIP